MKPPLRNMTNHPRPIQRSTRTQIAHLTNRRRSPGGRHRYGKQLCSNDMISHYSQGQSPTLILLSTSQRQDRPHRKLGSECRLIVYCLLWPEIARSRPKAASQTLLRIPCRSRMEQVKLHIPSVILCLELSHNPPRTRAWQKTRLRMFQSGSLTSDERLSTFQSRSLLALHGPALATDRHQAKFLREPLLQRRKTISWSSHYQQHSCQLA